MMSEYTPAQVRAFRYWIQGYPNFYEPLVGAYFQTAGYRVVRRPALVDKREIAGIIADLFDGRKILGPAVNTKVIIRLLETRSRLQPDLLLEHDGRYFLAELKSWGGYSPNGQFDLKTATDWFIRKPEYAAFLLVDRLDGRPIAGKILVASARGPDHDRILAALGGAYATSLDLLYLDEVLRTPALAPAIANQLAYLDAAVAELKAALRGAEV